ncbi:MAG: hypothetical protein H0W09_01995 [Solirubrobacterales bacterium]|nr:hypothetical protein [Solirubrobacterales bacterium]
MLPPTALGVGDIHVEHRALDDIDIRGEKIAPTAAQQAAAGALGSRVTWNEFGTPASLINDEGYLATGLGADEVAAARSFVEDNRELFRLSAGSAGGLELVSDSPMAAGSGHAVILRQRAGELPMTLDGLISVGVVDGRVAYVSSSAVGEGSLSGDQTISPDAAWLAAANETGLDLDANAIASSQERDGWTELEVSAISGPQRSRAVALPIPGSGSIRAFETLVIDSQAGTGYRSFVDAASGEVLVRESITAQLADNPRCPDGDVRGTQITVDLAGKRAHLLRRIQVSALLRPRRTLPSGDPDPTDPTQSRFAGLRRFRIETCNARRSGPCKGDDGFKRLFKSPKNAFPGGVPRPLSPDLSLRDFKVRKRAATHVRLIALTNQCTGAPEYQGELDEDPGNPTDCSESSAQAAELRANELQVFTGRSRLVR